MAFAQPKYNLSIKDVQRIDVARFLCALSPNVLLVFAKEKYSSTAAAAAAAAVAAKEKGNECARNEIKV